MNRLLNTLKNILILINIILLAALIINYSINTGLLKYIISFLGILTLNLSDLKDKIKLSNKLNILFIIVEFIVNFLLIRALLDKSMYYTDSNYIYTNLLYFTQNTFYLVLLYICLFIYHKIEIKKVSKYSLISIICLIVNIILIIPTMQCFIGETIHKLPFILCEIILIVLEIFSLIKYNRIKKEYIIYICFLFNLFALISIFI